jgi:hypothetical protein
MDRSWRLHSMATQITQSDTHGLLILVDSWETMCTCHPCQRTFKRFVTGSLTQLLW